MSFQGSGNGICREWHQGLANHTVLCVLESKRQLYLDDKNAEKPGTANRYSKQAMFFSNLIGQHVSILIRGETKLCN